jgi:hypothetical protein
MRQKIRDAHPRRGCPSAFDSGLLKGLVVSPSASLGRRTVTVLTILNTALAGVVRVVGHPTCSEIPLANRR